MRRVTPVSMPATDDYLYRIFSWGWGALLSAGTMGLASRGGVYPVGSGPVWTTGGTSGGAISFNQSDTEGERLALSNPTGDRNSATFGPGGFVVPSRSDPDRFTPIEFSVEAEVELSASQAGSAASFEFTSSNSSFRGAGSGDRIGFYSEPSVTGNANWWARIRNSAGLVSAAYDTGVSVVGANRLKLVRVNGPIRQEAHLEINRVRVASAFGGDVPSQDKSLGRLMYHYISLGTANATTLYCRKHIAYAKLI